MSQAPSSPATPFQTILSWWQPIPQPISGFIASSIVTRLNPPRRKRRDERILRDILSAGTPCIAQARIALEIVAAVDEYFVRHDPEQSLQTQLEAVETTTDPVFKDLMNFAIGNHAKVTPIINRARETWTHLRSTSLADTTLISLIPGYQPPPIPTPEEPCTELARRLAAAWLSCKFGLSLAYSYKIFVKGKLPGTNWLNLAQAMYEQENEELPPEPSGPDFQN